VEDYVIGEINNTDKKIEYATNIITSKSEILELREKIASLSQSIKTIQNSIGMEEADEITIDNFDEKIHNLVASFLSRYSIADCIPESQDWINPYWEKLEPESKHFIPTGIFLYKFLSEPSIDMAPIMIEFCKTLEKELFQKMFYGYIKNLIERCIDIATEFGDSLEKEATSIFAKFLLDCTTTYKNNPSEWKFEIGKMVIILQQTLAKKPKDLLIKDFRNYLDCTFEQQFFRENFNEQLSVIAKLRNACAHPYIVDRSKVDTGKEIIRKKLLSILKYYK